MKGFQNMINNCCQLGTKQGRKADLTSEWGSRVRSISAWTSNPKLHSLRPRSTEVNDKLWTRRGWNTRRPATTSRAMFLHHPAASSRRSRRSRPRTDHQTRAQETRRGRPGRHSPSKQQQSRRASTLQETRDLTPAAVPRLGAGSWCRSRQSTSPIRRTSSAGSGPFLWGHLRRESDGKVHCDWTNARRAAWWRQNLGANWLAFRLTARTISEAWNKTGVLELHANIR